MTVSSTASILPAPQAKPTKIESAAKQFEGLMIGEMLRSARESSADDTDSESSAVLDMADQQFSQLLANNGGLGLASMVVKGLNQGEQNAHSQ